MRRRRLWRRRRRRRWRHKRRRRRSTVILSSLSPSLSPPSSPPSRSFKLNTRPQTQRFAAVAALFMSNERAAGRLQPRFFLPKKIESHRRRLHAKAIGLRTATAKPIDFRCRRRRHRRRLTVDTQGYNLEPPLQASEKFDKRRISRRRLTSGGDKARRLGCS